MSAEQQPQKRSVSEISHLFLSNVRDIHGNGAARPQRTPPGGQSSTAAPLDALPAALTPQPSARTQATSGMHSTCGVTGVPSVDLTPEEYAQVFGARSPAIAGASSEINHETSGFESAPVAPVTAILASHLSGRQLERAREYARHIAASSTRVGLIDLDVSEFRLFCFDPAVEPGAESESRPAPLTGLCDPREIADAVEELNVDVNRWLLLLPNLGTPEARAMIRECEHWVLLCTCDHDGVVSAYRTLKGVIESRLSAGQTSATRLSLAVLDAAGDAEAVRVQQKLAGVCRQFLDWEVEAESPVRYAAGVAEHPLMNCRVSRDKAQLAGGAHWEVISRLLARLRRGEEVEIPEEPQTVTAIEPALMARPVATEPAIRRVDPAEPIPAAASEPVINSDTARAAPAFVAEMVIPMSPISARPTGPSNNAGEVIDLPGDATDGPSVLAAVLRRPESGLIECPVIPPTGGMARLAVSRDCGLVLVAVAMRGLTEMRSIGRAYQWLLENRSLIAMAVPQFSIDLTKDPMLHLLVDQQDISADLLRPMMQSGHVSIRAYRTLRWCGRTGLLLDAA